MPSVDNKVLDLHISSLTKQRYSTKRKRISNDGVFVEPLIDEVVAGTEEIIDVQYNLLSQQAHENLLEDLKERYEARFIVHRKLLRRRHVRKEQKRLHQAQRVATQKSRGTRKILKAIIDEGNKSDVLTINGAENLVVNNILVETCGEKLDVDEGNYRISSYKNEGHHICSYQLLKEKERDYFPEERGNTVQNLFSSVKLDKHRDLFETTENVV
mmetsp:Transcript_41429/g.47088  ORF Transcript_41429/g.47088 Transcript_41429/m.47088 type:complete len:214 (+) Transcript_41429:110-751(+)